MKFFLALCLFILHAHGLPHQGQDLESSKADTSKIKFYLYTRNNRNFPQEIKHDQSNLGNSNYVSSKITYFLIHGWNSDINFADDFRKELLDHSDCNVFGIDWNELESWTNYIAAAKTSLEVGTYVGNFAGRLIQKGLSHNKVHTIGHSLGAQASGHFGREVKRITGSIIKRISGLDPAKPWFDLQPSSVRLQKSDANFVDIIHVNSGDLVDGCLSFFEQMGHIDFYPAGGVHQPGCTEACAGSCTDNDLIDLIKGGCSHGRANKYFVESINAGPFTGTKCNSYESFQNNGCPLGNKQKMGFPVNSSPGDGKYWLEVNEIPPYAQG